MLNKTLFITLEGLDGSGKSTLASKIHSFLSCSVLTHEPGGTDFGKKLRPLILQEEKPIDAITETLLFLSDRMEHIKKVILPSLEKSQSVISDRYMDSTLAYQHYGRGVSLDWFQPMLKIAPKPDVTFFLDISYEDSLKRVEKRARQNKTHILTPKDSTENALLDVHFFQKAREGFLVLSKANHVVTLDASLSQEVLEGKVLNYLNHLGQP